MIYTRFTHSASWPFVSIFRISAACVSGSNLLMKKDKILFVCFLSIPAHVPWLYQMNVCLSISLSIMVQVRKFLWYSRESSRSGDIFFFLNSVKSIEYYVFVIFTEKTLSRFSNESIFRKPLFTLFSIKLRKQDQILTGCSTVCLAAGSGPAASRFPNTELTTNPQRASSSIINGILFTFIRK